MFEVDSWNPPDKAGLYMPKHYPILKGSSRPPTLR